MMLHVRSSHDANEIRAATSSQQSVGGARTHHARETPLPEGDGDLQRLKIVRCGSRRLTQAYKIHKSRFAALIVKEYAQHSKTIKYSLGAFSNTV